MELRPEALEGVEAIAYDGIPSQKVIERLDDLIEADSFHLEVSHLYAMEEAPGHSRKC